MEWHQVILPGCFWCNALIFIHSRKIHISNPNFCGNFYFQLQQNTIEITQSTLHILIMVKFTAEALALLSPSPERVLH